MGGTAAHGVSRRYAVASDGDALWVSRDGHHLETRTARRARAGAAASEGSLEAPMPGTVLLVHVANGDAVAEGDVLLVLESTKMELAIAANDATVKGGTYRAQAPLAPVGYGVFRM